MKRKCKHWIGSLFFFLGLALLLLLFSKLMIPKDNREEAGMENEIAHGILAEPKDTIDVIVLGDSETVASISPLEIWEKEGITVYVCGTTGQTLCEAEYYLREMTENQNPKILLLETNFFYKEFTYRDLLRTQAEKVFPVIRYHDRWKTLRTEDFTSAPAYTHIENDKGYRWANDVLPADDSEYMAVTEEKEPIPGKNRWMLQQLLKACRKRGMEVILVSTPSTINWNGKRHNTVVDLAEEYSLEYIDMNQMREEIPIDWEKDTRDYGDHLNHDGAKKVSSYLADFLKKKMPQTDHRQETGYEGWEEALTEYHNKYGY